MRKLNIAFTYVTKSALLFLLLSPIIFIGSTSEAAEDSVNWVPFVPGAEPRTRSQVLPKSSDTMGLCVDSNFFGMYRIATYINETRYDQLHVPSAGHATVVGKPAVPMITRFLEIPDDVQVSIQILYTDMQVLEGFNVIPAQEPREDVANATEPPFVIDRTTYTTNAFYPTDIAFVEGADGLDPIVIRDHRIVALSFFPVQFNPVTQRLRVYSKIEVRLNYDEAGQVGPIDGRLYSPAFETLLSTLILNYRHRPPLKMPPWGFVVLPVVSSPQSTTLKQHSLFQSPQEEVEGAEYLIITHDDFFQQVHDLADWKERKGLITEVVKTSQINDAGPTADDIASYVQTAYDTWYPAPSYVLMVGDSEFIPPHYSNPHPSSYHGGFETPTDLYYATVDGSDYFPDIYIGRLSVDTPAQAEAIIDKILNYTRDPPDDVGFYNQMSACAYFQDNLPPEFVPGVGWVADGDGVEEGGYVFTSEEVRNYSLTQGYSVDRIYWTRADVTPMNYTATLPLSTDLLRANGFQWDGNEFDIFNNVTDGRFLVYHRDHGSSRNAWNHNDGDWGANVDGWTRPDFDTVNIGWLAGVNPQLLPVILSVECQCGWFDGEVDQLNDGNLTRNFESFCEVFVRLQNGGAIAAIGATRNSATRYNNRLLKGFIDAIWPGFDPDFASGGLFELGQMLTYGEVYMAHFYGYGGARTMSQFEVFHLFGDPEMELWTAQPGELDVMYPTQIGSNGLQKFVLNVTDHDTGKPVPHAKVCLQKETEVHSVAYTDPAGGAYFAVHPSAGGKMNITVTKHNYIPYQDEITVTGDGATLTVNPEIGPSGINAELKGSNFQDDEKVDIYFGGTTSDTTVTASAGSFTETFDIPGGPVGPLNVFGVGQTSGRRAVALFRRLPVQLLPDPYIYCQWDSTTWHLNPAGGDPRWNNPDIQLYDADTGVSVASNDLRVDKTYIVRATIHNDATVDATGTTVTFEWAFMGGGQRNWYWFGDDTVTVPAGDKADAEVQWTPSKTGHTCIMATIHHDWDENLDNNRGQENTDVLPVSSPGEIDFIIGNPTQQSALVYLEARQVGGPDLWIARVKRDYPQVQEPEENRTVTLSVEAPDGAEVGEKRIFTVSCYIDGELIGGIEVEVVVHERESPSWCPSLLVLILVLIGVILFFIRGRSREVKLLGLIVIVIAIIIYLLVCVLR